MGGIPEGGDPLNIGQHFSVFWDKEALGRRAGTDDLVDSPGFDARMYYENLISQSGLEELMKTASSLSAGTLYEPCVFG